MKFDLISRLTFLLFALFMMVGCGTQLADSQVTLPASNVSLQLEWVHQAEFAGYYVANQEGLYSANGLEVKMISGGPTVNPIDKVALKEVDFAIISNPIDLLKARQSGQHVVAVAALFQRDANVWISLAEKNITTPQALKGQRVGLKTTAMTSFELLLATANMTLAEVQMVQLADPTIRPLVAGEVDVLLGLVIDEPLLARRQGYNINVLTLADQGVILPSDLLIVHEDLLRDKPDLVKRFVQASLKGWEMTINQPKLGLTATLRVDETLNVTQQTEMLAEVIKLIQPDSNAIGFMNDDLWTKIIQLALAQKLVTQPIEPHQAYTTQFLLP